MNPFRTLKTLVLNHLAKQEMPTSLERGILSDQIAGRVVPFGEVITFDHDAAERFARSCIDETIFLLQDRIGRERRKI